MISAPLLAFFTPKEQYRNNLLILYESKGIDLNSVLYRTALGNSNKTLFEDMRLIAFRMSRLFLYGS